MDLFQEYLVNSIRNSKLVRMGSGEISSMLMAMNTGDETGIKRIRRYLDTFGKPGKRPNVNMLAAVAMCSNLPVDLAQRIASFRDITLAEALLRSNNIQGTELEQVSPTDLCICNLERVVPTFKDEDAYVDAYSWQKYLFEKFTEDAGVPTKLGSRGFYAYQQALDDYRYFFFHSSTTFASFEALLPIALGQHGHECVEFEDEVVARKKIVRMHQEKLGEWYAEQNGLEIVPGPWAARILGWEV